MQKRIYESPLDLISVGLIQGSSEKIDVGNLDAERDFIDIADLVRALILLMEHGEPGEAYNVATGISHPMRWYLTAQKSWYVSIMSAIVKYGNT